MRVLHYHEIANGVVDGRPVAVTWCPLCASAVVYDRRVEAAAATPDGDAAGFPLPVVADRGGAMTATVGGREVVVFATPDGIHAFENPGLSFAPAGDGDDAADSDGDAHVSDGGGTPDDGGAGVFSTDGARWDGATDESDDGRALRRVPARRLFAFAWQDDHGPDSFVGLA